MLRAWHRRSLPFSRRRVDEEAGSTSGLARRPHDIARVEGVDRRESDRLCIRVDLLSPGDVATVSGKKNRVPAGVSAIQRHADERGGAPRPCRALDGNNRRAVAPSG